MILLISLMDLWIGFLVISANMKRRKNEKGIYNNIIHFHKYNQFSSTRE